LNDRVNQWAKHSTYKSQQSLPKPDKLGDKRQTEPVHALKCCGSEGTRFTLTEASGTNWQHKPNLCTSNLNYPSMAKLFFHHWKPGCKNLL